MRKQCLGRVEWVGRVRTSGCGLGFRPRLVRA